mmetsp:Transcript_12254/g.26427  ORF Transcript_12254/g.26427 Transcript_12254/m.26427 type:complete len:272 (+) Transcript_12254:401-1216(+)
MGSLITSTAPCSTWRRWRARRLTCSLAAETSRQYATWMTCRPWPALPNTAPSTPSTSTTRGRRWHPTPHSSLAATTRPPITCGSSTMVAGRRPTSTFWVLQDACALAACVLRACRASTATVTTSRAIMRRYPTTTALYAASTTRATLRCTASCRSNSRWMSSFPMIGRATLHHMATRQPCCHARSSCEQTWNLASWAAQLLSSCFTRYSPPTGSARTSTPSSRPWCSTPGARPPASSHWTSVCLGGTSCRSWSWMPVVPCSLNTTRSGWPS